MPPLKIAIAGTGNVGYHLAKKFTEAKHEPVAIASRTVERSEHLISVLGLSAKAVSIEDLKEVAADLIILSIPDNAIEKVIETSDFPPDSTVVHTSGSQPMSLLAKAHKYGVLYPFQTFTRNKEINFSPIPVFIEGSDLTSLAIIRKAAQLLNNDVREVNSQDRLSIHLAAVFACNFSNHLFAIAEDLLKGTSGKLQDLNHLMWETVDKAVQMSAGSAQTGPAVRGDSDVIQKHLNMLQEIPEAREVYQLLTKQIAERIQK